MPPCRFTTKAPNHCAAVTTVKKVVFRERGIMFSTVRKVAFCSTGEGFGNRQRPNKAECIWFQYDSKKSGFSQSGGKLSTVKKVVCRKKLYFEQL